MNYNCETVWVKKETMAKSLSGRMEEWLRDYADNPRERTSFAMNCDYGQVYCDELVVLADTLAAGRAFLKIRKAREKDTRAFGEAIVTTAANADLLAGGGDQEVMATNVLVRALLFTPFDELEAAADKVLEGGA